MELPSPQHVPVRGLSQHRVSRSLRHSPFLQLVLVLQSLEHWLPRPPLGMMGGKGKGCSYLAEVCSAIHSPFCVQRNLGLLVYYGFITIFGWKQDPVSIEREPTDLLVG